MRKEKRAIRDTAAIEEMLRRCRTLQLGLWDGEEPYVVTVNFGYEAGAIYFHSALAGRKLDCVRRNGLVSFFTMVESELIRADSPCGYTTHFKSVTGVGRGEELTDPDAKAAGLAIIMAQHGGPTTGFDPRVLARTAVVRVNIREMVGKVNPAFAGDPQV